MCHNTVKRTLTQNPRTNPKSKKKNYVSNGVCAPDEELDFFAPAKISVHKVEAKEKSPRSQKQGGDEGPSHSFH